MALSGITTCADMYWYPDSTVDAALEVGVRVATGAIYIDFDGVVLYTKWEQRIAAGKDFCERYSGNEKVVPLLCPHSVYSASMPQLEELGLTGRRFGCGCPRTRCGSYT